MRSSLTSSKRKVPPSQPKEQSPTKPTLEHLWHRLPPAVRDAVLTQRYFWQVAAAILAGELVLTFAIIRYIPYTEIDFSTYMQQANLFQAKGIRDYSQITGDTGPCVYPAGHLYFYSFVHWLTTGGQDLRIAQYIFGGLYLVSQILSMAIYQKVGAPPYLLPILATSKRLHSIYSLRMFNDGVAMTVMLLAILLVPNHKYTLGVIVTSLALSVKMNILLYLPALALILLRAQGFWPALAQGVTLVVVQVLLSVPFTLVYPKEYFGQAFDLSRQFLYKWTVNLRFLPEGVFLSTGLSATLLVLHASLLVAFIVHKWTAISRLGAWRWVKGQWKSNEDLSPRFIVLSLFTSNLIGVLCARSLHYQFYSWYAQSLPLLLWSAELRATSKALLPFAIEMAWNTYPSTEASSFLLCASHAMLLLGLFKMNFEVANGEDKTRAGLERRGQPGEGQAR